MFRLNFWVYLFVLLLVTSPLYGQYTPPAGSPLANHEHPRLYFTDSKLQQIRDYINTYEHSDFQSFINEVNGVYNTSPTSKNRNLLLFDTMNFAFLSYAVHSGYFSNYNFNHTASEYAQKAYDHAVVINNVNPPENHNCANLSSKDEGGYANLSMAVLYDWCFDYLSLSHKQMIANFFIRYWNNRDPDVSPGHHSKLDNNVTVYSHSAGVGGIACWGDDLGSPINNTIQDILNAIKWLWFDRYLLAGNQILENTFGWGEGPSYVKLSLTNIHFFMTALSSAININLYNEYNWLHDIGLYFYNYVEPLKLSGAVENGLFLQRNDTGALAEWDHTSTLRVILPVASMLKNDDPTYAGFIRWVIKDSQFKMINGDFENEDPRNYWLFFKFLWGIKDIAPKTPQETGIKKSYRFGLGEVKLRSDFNTQNTTKINFYTPGYFTPSHASWDHGAFSVFKYGSLILNEAGNGKSGADFPRVNQGGDPIFSNVLAIYPSGATTYRPPDTNIEENADAYNDPANQPGGANDMGDVLAMDFREDTFDYVDYNYKLSYKGVNYVNKARRKLLYIRDPNAPNYSDHEYLLIFDDVAVNNANVKRRFLLHPAYRPELSDGSWTQNGSGYWTSTNASTIEISNTYANSHGRMFVKVLEPSNYKFILRGGTEGSNHYWFTDAEGNNLAESGYDDFYTDWAAFWVSSYRLEIEDQANSTSSQFLTVMQIGDANTLNNMVAVDEIDAGSFVGAFINQDRISFFNKTNSPESTINYSFNSNKNVWHIITGLQPGLYYVKVNGNLITGLNTIVNENGVLYFQYSSGGNFAISKSSDTIAPQKPQGLLIKP